MIVVAAAYCFGLAPLLEPPPKPRIELNKGVTIKQDSASGSEFVDLFEEGSWQLSDPFTLKTDRGTVLFGDYKMAENGLITVNPVSLVVRGAGSPGKPGRVYVLDAPEARLAFENGLDLSKNGSGLGKLLDATLIGEVTIYSPPSSDLADDAISITTRHVRIDPTSISTPQTIDMHFGPHYLRGQDLKLSFLNPEQKLKTSGVARWVFSDLEITTIEEVKFFVAGDGIELFGDSAKSADTKKAPASNGAESTPIEIRCAGRFKIDFLMMEASFRKQVEVLRLPVRGQADSLRCEVLTLAFQAGGEEGVAKNRLSSKFAPSKLTATGSPAVLVSPSVDVSAKCDEMEYWIDSKKIILKDSKFVSLTRGMSEFKSPTIEYTLAKEARRLGKLHAKGKGELIAVDPRYPSRSIRAEWDQELKLEPDGPLHRLEMRAGAGLFLAGGQHKFTAREMKLWLEEQGAPVAVARARKSNSRDATRRASWQESDELSAPMSANGPNSTQGMFDVRPKRMLAIGSVDAETPELKGATQRMELIFHYPTAESGAATTNNRGGPATQKKKTPRNEGPPEAKYDLVGDYIEVEIDSDGDDEPVIREVTVHKNLRFERFDLTDPSAPPLRISGDQFRLTGGIRGDAEVVIAGAPAEVNAEGVSIEGPEIHLQQRKNRVFIEQPGKVTIRDLPAALASESGKDASAPFGQSMTPKLIEVTWQGRMDFDGKKVEFKKQVNTNLLLADREGIENEVEIQSGVLEIHLSRPVSFGPRASMPEARFGEELGLDHLVFDEGVDVTNDAFGPNQRRTAFDQLHSRNLSYDHLTGGFKADGPGYVSSVRKGMPSSGAMAFPVGNSKGGKPSATKGKKDPKQLTYIRVDFDGGITGNMLKRDLTFERRVNAVYSPVDAWDSVIDPNQRGGLGEQGIALRSEALSLFQSPTSTNEEAHYEFEANGNVMIEGKNFIAYGSRASYVPAKDSMMLEGDPRKDCEVHLLDDFGVETGKQAAGRMTYDTRTRGVVVLNVGLGSFRETPQLKLPPTGGARPLGSPPAQGPPQKPSIYRPGQR
jgi:hypothetical protein